MAVNLFICPTLVASDTSSPSEFSDALSGGGSGLSLGQVANSLYAPIVDQATNDGAQIIYLSHCLLYTSPSPRDLSTSRMPSSA